MELAIQKGMTVLNWVVVVTVLVLALVGYLGGGARENRKRLLAAVIASVAGFIASLPLYRELASFLFLKGSPLFQTILMGFWFLIFVSVAVSIYELLTVSRMEIFGGRK
ncbi:hypothetical protein A3I42_03065 [Candidatus Uhrbacteria bacterium RIFCSPLOWO2_02_FULL_49_11]|uniref:Uncharacterized protein n=1 Tax=Candidatus Uhrbacteria bacterium RIFCSPLOWO2_02_FULL_49_11 TaxID=1802409 RepID=A0A1F7VDF8_9BACT|nr:MAG: hypothetical protein A3I42_03065 [Candidatus Uhrbacteria bacterium RIFCSPLOWO2_02_FULL_49_11]